MKYSKRSAMIAAVVILNFILSANNRGTMATFVCPIDHTSCYKLLSDKMAWPGAKDACKDPSISPAGSYLYVPSSSSEEDLINGLFTSINEYYIGCEAVSVNAFECFHENELLEYTNWKNVNQPDGDTVKGVLIKNGFWEQSKDSKNVLCELPNPKVVVQPITRTCRSGTYVAYPSSNTCMGMTTGTAALPVIESLKNVKRCGAACMKHLSCYSFNFIRNSEQDEGGRCELFGAENGYMVTRANCQHYTLE